MSNLIAFPSRPCRYIRVFPLKRPGCWAVAYDGDAWRDPFRHYHASLTSARAAAICPRVRRGLPVLIERAAERGRAAA